MESHTLLPSRPRAMEQYTSDPNLKAPRQERLQTVQKTLLQKNNGIGEQQTPGDSTSGQISDHSTSQNICDQRAKQKEQTYNARMREIARRMKLLPKPRHSRGDSLEQEQWISVHDSPDVLQMHQNRHIQLANAKKPGGIRKINHVFRRKIMESRVVKSSSLKSANSKSGATRAMGENDGGGMIRVFINNRLGAKAEILCSPSDTIGDIKKLAARKLGTDATAIGLKRQGQRAFRDAIILEDYEIGNGSCLDYEIDI